MIIDNLKVEIIEFESLWEFLKLNTSHYILKYEIDEDEAIYYSVLDSNSFAMLSFCFDKNFKSESIKIENNKVCEHFAEPTGTSIVLVKVKADSFLTAVMDYIFEEEEEPKSGDKPARHPKQKR
jgi:hypothetical protein